jgi:aryl-alcohol dehydrogenase-like predicted oxidoreductase
VETRALGSTGLIVPRIGLGTVKIGRNTAVRYPARFDLPDGEALNQLLETALELGVTLLDTAPAYGTSEERLGPFVARHRDRLVICTKCGETFDGTASAWDFSGTAITASVERSLRRLRTETVDVLLLHSDGNDETILSREDTLSALAALKRAGKVRATGISAKSARGVELGAERLDVVMAPYSAAQPSLGPSLARARAAGAGVLAIKGLGQGQLGRTAGVSAVTDAVRAVLAAPFVDSLIVGTLNPAHLREIVAAAEGLP